MVELSLSHDGEFWIATNESLRARARTLAALDREVARRIGEIGGFASVEDTLEVRMVFDRSVIPEWIRQYSGHYFNRVVKMELPR